jgi:hypothetical protein
LDLTTEPLSIINQRLSNSSLSTPTRSTSFTLVKPYKKPDLPLTHPSSPLINMNNHQQPIIGDSRSRFHAPLTSPTKKFYLISQTNSRYQHLGQPNINTQKPSITTERGRTFVHHSDSRPFILGAAIQMKPIDDILLPNEKRRPCHRQNALRYKLNEQDRPSRISAPLINTHHPPSTNISRYQSIERRITPSPPQSFSFGINNELQLSDISWSVREKAKLFEHTNHHKLSTGRENYV